MLHFLDQKIVEFIAVSGHRCTFTNAVSWNSIVTVLDTDMDIPLPLTREAIAVLMMAKALCNDPDLRSEICPNLRLPVVLFLLMKEVPDDMLPGRNDWEAFMKHWHLVPMGPECLSARVVWNEDFGGVWDGVGRDWRKAEFSEEQLDAFPYLRSYFAR
jgi:hypothetical protein